MELNKENRQAQIKALQERLREHVSNLLMALWWSGKKDFYLDQPSSSLLDLINKETYCTEQDLKPTAIFIDLLDQ